MFPIILLVVFYIIITCVDVHILLGMRPTLIYLLIDLFNLKRPI